MNSNEIQRPWGLLTGLLAACFVTLIGVGSGLDPDIVLQRALYAGGALGVLAAGTARLLRLLNKPS